MIRDQRLAACAALCLALSCSDHDEPRGENDVQDVQDSSIRREGDASLRRDADERRRDGAPRGVIDATVGTRVLTLTSWSGAVDILEGVADADESLSVKIGSSGAGHSLSIVLGNRRVNGSLPLTGMYNVSGTPAASQAAVGLTMPDGKEWIGRTGAVEITEQSGLSVSGKFEVELVSAKNLAEAGEPVRGTFAGELHILCSKLEQGSNDRWERVAVTDPFCIEYTSSAQATR
jgi:hypothetical protein